jgi:hypothetical protein
MKVVHCIIIMCNADRLLSRDKQTLSTFLHAKHLHTQKAMSQHFYSRCTLNAPPSLRRTQHRFILIAHYMYATRFDPFSGHHQGCQYKKKPKERYVLK